MNDRTDPALLEPDAAAWLDVLNPAQRAAAGWGEHASDGRFRAGPQLVIAGAGTGKTAMLAHRVAHLVMAGVAPERIALLTFSRRAAQEMIRRAESLVGKALAERADQHAGGQAGARAGRRAPVAFRLTWAGTFHAIGARLLREHAERIGLDPGFGILDRADAADLLDQVRHEQGLSSQQRRFPRKETCLGIYSFAVNTGWPLDRVLREHFPWCLEWCEELRGLFRAYVDRKLEHGVLDYDDLLLWWDTAMSDQALALEIGARFDHVLVDEYQDTNALQARILLAMKPDGGGLTVVGDDAQSIYAFRAAEVDNILGFPDCFDPPARRVTLATNYRSRQSILDLANTLVAEGERLYPRSLHAHPGGGGARPRLVTVLDDRAQSDWLIDEILRQREAGIELRRQAVLFRTAWHSDGLEVELMRRNIPFVKYGGLKFLESAHVKDLLAVLRWADNPRNGIAAFRALQLLPGIGPTIAQRLFDRVAHDGGRFEALADAPAPAAAGDDWPALVALLHGLASPDAAWPAQLEPVRNWYQPLLEARFDDAAVRGADLDMLVAVAGQFESRERFLTELTLDPPQASGDLAGDPLLDEDYLILSTVHSAKGREWDSVYVINVADGNFPNEYATGDAAAIEEERRLLYVAATRARDSLSLVEPLRYRTTRQPRLGGDYVHGARSRFLTPAVLACLDATSLAGPAGAGPASSARGGPIVDVATRLRARW
ncbi:MAG: ATP-dependent helicase [Burkholderiaceae bacterium]